ncbi:hypothetical protein P691DRAFT_553135 [Macrolepiota fuliginosa MF-IS2]|uniref:DUF6533 domain-containing protein n=1 Tax=Macrolepiota fuliginosa MF-IS2 TaxID=1400762 RepID=A0A9P6C5L7_9AGAR|nr:hypothetical protein P691DRAFT_553135 [Macrolepiota fuliginosa MF-IS2]
MATSTNAAQLAQEVAIIVDRSRQVNYGSLAGTTILVLDWFLTLDMEVTHVWNSPWSVMKVLYLVSRYTPFIDIPTGNIHQFGYAVPEKTCHVMYDCTAWMFTVGMAIADLIFTFRTWVIWGKTKPMGWALAALYAAIWILALVILGIYLPTVIHEASPFPELFGCIARSPSTLLSTSYIAFMVFEAIMLLLVVVRGISDLRNGGSESRLMRLVYRDGVIYYIYIFCLSTLNAITILKFPKDYGSILLGLQRMVHSVLSCRVILHIREQARKQEHGGLGSTTDVTQLSSIQFPDWRAGGGTQQSEP